MDLAALTLTELREQLRTRAVSPVEALDALEQRIAAVDPLIHGYLNRDLDQARKLAESADITLPLGGVPIAIKDVLNVRGQPCTCASKILRGYVAPYDATAIAKLRAAGAIPFGRTNMDEFAMGSSTENSSLGATARVSLLGTGNLQSAAQQVQYRADVDRRRLITIIDFRGPKIGLHQLENRVGKVREVLGDPT